MKRGIRFKIPNEHGKIICEILSKDIIREFSWFVEDGEILAMGKDGKYNSVFHKKYWSGEEFLTCVKEQEYYIVNCKIIGFNEVGEEETNTYEKFSKSKSEILLIISDSIFVDIYCKNLNNLEQLFKINFKRECLEYICEIDDRISMSI